MALSVDCPACGDGLEVADEHRGWTVRCPSCRHEFVAESDEPPRRGRPGRRRRRDDDADDADLIADARVLVAGPASWLRGYGLLQVAFGILGAFAAVAMFLFMANNPAQARRQGKGQDDLIVNIVIIGFSSVCAVVVGGVTAYGAGKMARLESHGWGTTAAILALGSIMYCTCGLFVGIPIGIWALVALNKPDVTSGFRAAATRRAGVYHSDADDDD